MAATGLRRSCRFSRRAALSSGWPSEQTLGAEAELAFLADDQVVVQRQAKGGAGALDLDNYERAITRVKFSMDF